MSVKLAGKLPKDEKNGLAALSAIMDENPLIAQVVVGVVVPSKRVADYDHPDDPVQYHFRLATIEPLSGAEAEAAQKLLGDAFTRRTGMERLDFGDGE